jgi:hypothetical protein
MSMSMFSDVTIFIAVAIALTVLWFIGFTYRPSTQSSSHFPQSPWWLVIFAPIIAVLFTTALLLLLLTRLWT